MEIFSNDEVDIMIDNNIDKRNVLDEEPFSYKVVKDNKVLYIGMINKLAS